MDFYNVYFPDSSSLDSFFGEAVAIGLIEDQILDRVSKSMSGELRLEIEMTSSASLSDRTELQKIAEEFDGRVEEHQAHEDTTLGSKQTRRVVTKRVCKAVVELNTEERIEIVRLESAAVAEFNKSQDPYAQGVIHGIRRVMTKLQEFGTVFQGLGPAPRPASKEAVARKYIAREPNPWAVCTESVGREDKKKYERCVLKVKKQKD